MSPWLVAACLTTTAAAGEPDGAESAEGPPQGGASAEALPEGGDAAEPLPEGGESAEALLEGAEGAEALLAHGRVLLDERLPTEERVAAAQALGRADDPRALWLLRAGARDRDSAVALASVRAALAYPGLEAVAVALPLLRDDDAPRDTRSAAVDALGAHGSGEAARLLWDLTSERRVTALVRADALHALERHYAAELAAFGQRHSVVDPLGGATFVTASGLAGGIALSSVGVWGQFDGAAAIGAVGGAAIGLGTGSLFAVSKPLTAGQGLAFASGVGWGLTGGAWTTTTVHGGWPWLAHGSPERERAVDLGAAYRAVGVGAGAAVGALAASRDPVAWDVLEVDLAGYLGSAVVLAGAGLALYHPPSAVDDLDAYVAYRRGSTQVLAGLGMAGAAAGLGAGLLLHDRWELDWQDGSFAFVAGLEAAWLGTWAPTALGVDDRQLKGTIRLPWHAAVIGGLVLSEAYPVSWARTGSGAWAGAATNGLGAGAALLAGGSDSRTVAQIMLPVGLAGTTGGLLAGDWLDPRDGDWAMLGFGTGVAAAQSGLVASGLQEVGALDDAQVPGLVLVATGGVGSGLLVLGRWVEPRVDTMLVLTSAAGWGAYYGALVPVGLELPGDPGGVLLSSGFTSQAFTLGAGLALLPGVGLEPRHTIVPQLAGLSGATVGALGVALASGEGDDVALGSVVGSLVGFGVGAGVVATADRGGAADLQLPVLRRLPGIWTPEIAPLPGADGGLGVRVGVRGVGW